jgi:5-methylcytosine-specific restriction endonuclease McrA
MGERRESRVVDVVQPSVSPPISARLRFRILVRDRFRCVYCGAKASDPGVELHVDHVKPRSQGGTNEPSNLATSCRPCNEGKSDVTVWSEEEGVI